MSQRNESQELNENLFSERKKDSALKDSINLSNKRKSPNKYIII